MIFQGMQQYLNICGAFFLADLSCLTEEIAATELFFSLIFADFRRFIKRCFSFLKR
jgi:hypothetical protein